MKGNFSVRAIEAIKNTTDSGMQVLILQNRKGYASYLECEDCHHIPYCPNCDVSLTYYKEENFLKCKYCGEEITNNRFCPNGHSNYKTVGGGTEKIEEELGLLLPELRIIRADAESLKGKKALERAKRDFSLNI